MSAADRASWSELARTAVEPNPFYEPANLLPAAAHLRDGSDVSLAFVRDGHRMLAALPVRRLLNVGPMRVITGRIFQVVSLSTPLLAEGAPQQTMGQLLKVLCDDSGAGVLTLEWFGDGGAVAHALRTAARDLKMPCRAYKQWRRPVLHQDAGTACVQSRCTLCQRCPLLSPKRARALNRWQRGLARELGAWPEVTDHSGDPEWVERYLSLEGAGWKGALSEGDGALAHRPGHAGWFRESALALSRSGMARMFSFTAGPQLLAMFYVMVTPGRGVFACLMTYEERFRQYAPGVQLLLGTMRSFFQDSREPLYDSCTAPGNTHFPEFFPDWRPISNVAVGIGSAGARATVAFAPVCAPVLAGAKRCSSRLTARWTVP